MATQRERPYPGMNFRVDLGTGETDGAEAGLVEVIFPEARLQVLEYRNGNERELDPKLQPTVTKYSNLILRRAAFGSLSWYNWWNAVRNGDQTARREIKVFLMNEDYSGTVLTWFFRRASPVNYQFSPLNAMGMEPLIESLEVAFERMEME
jgi:phage tail-like protein